MIIWDFVAESWREMAGTKIDSKHCLFWRLTCLNRRNEADICRECVPVIERESTHSSDDTVVDWEDRYEPRDEICVKISLASVNTEACEISIEWARQQGILYYRHRATVIVPLLFHSFTTMKHIPSSHIIYT